MFSHGFQMVRVRRINNGFIGLNGFWVRLQGGALVSSALTKKCTNRADECRLLCWCSWDSCTPWRKLSALLVQLRQLHPLEVSGCVGTAGMPYPPTSASAICGSISSRRFCEFCVFCGSWLLRSENFSKKLWNSPLNPMQILYKWVQRKSSFWRNGSRVLRFKKAKVGRKTIKSEGF